MVLRDKHNKPRGCRPLDPRFSLCCTRTVHTRRSKGRGRSLALATPTLRPLRERSKDNKERTTQLNTSARDRKRRKGKKEEDRKMLFLFAANAAALQHGLLAAVASKPPRRSSCHMLTPTPFPSPFELLSRANAKETAELLDELTRIASRQDPQVRMRRTRLSPVSHTRSLGSSGGMSP